MPTTTPQSSPTNYKLDVERRAEAMGATVSWSLEHMGEAWADMMSRTLYAKRPLNRVEYYVAMHELGHLATTPPMRPESQGEEVMWEARATAWAFEHGAWPVTNDVRKLLLDWALLSYVKNGYTLPEGDQAYRTLVASTPARRALFERTAREAEERDAYGLLMLNRTLKALGLV